MIHSPKNIDQKYFFSLSEKPGTIFLALGLSSQSTRCKLDFYKYPFDVQNCSITIGSWSYDSTEINFMTLGALDAGIINNDPNYISHPYCQLDSFSQGTKYDSSRFLMINKRSSPNPMYTSQQVAFYLSLKRRPLYQMVTSVFPVLVFNCLILMVFVVPSFPVQISTSKKFIYLSFFSQVHVHQKYLITFSRKFWTKFFEKMLFLFTFKSISSNFVQLK
jgi:hypothetical protein